MKSVQRILNNNFKEKYIAFRELEKEMIIKPLEDNFNEFQSLEPVDKFIALRYFIWQLSFFMMIS
ncbi:hypothetical protein [Flavivirga jejuensis]|uniref:Uncharacterized protein n=1 Tax=Flavivirga jejuensis TaxID=870487 RepID=A0ABT8WV43_9FLAO|nr:hypothetical protein [Flavivirga jejuensis]MDO5977058.1 hypothetical protein [Flavivirga jejuensis]